MWLSWIFPLGHNIAGKVSWSVISSEDSAEEGPTSKLTHVVVVKIQVLTGSWLRDSGPHWLYWSESSLTSFPHELLQRAIDNTSGNFHQSEKVRKQEIGQVGSPIPFVTYSWEKHIIHFYHTIFIKSEF